MLDDLGLNRGELLLHDLLVLLELLLVDEVPLDLLERHDLGMSGRGSSSYELLKSVRLLCERGRRNARRPLKLPRHRVVVVVIAMVRLLRRHRLNRIRPHTRIKLKLVPWVGLVISDLEVF